MREAPRGNFEFSEALGAGAGIENRGNGWLQSKPNASNERIMCSHPQRVNFISPAIGPLLIGVTVYRSICISPRISWFILTFADAKDI